MDHGGACYVDTRWQWYRPRLRGLCGMSVWRSVIYLGGPAPANRTSLAISTATRHPGIALALAQANFPAEKLVLAALLLYLLINAIVSIPYILWIKRRQQKIVNQVEG